MKQLDFYFPFFVFFYGIVVILVTETAYFAKIGKDRMVPQFEKLQQHKPLAWISFFLGGLWSVQNIWLG
ncbi:MAG: hypothetical protein V4736_09725 [Bdellovibrionota bacterium]